MFPTHRELLTWAAAVILLTGVASAGLASSAFARQAAETEFLGDEAVEPGECLYRQSGAFKLRNGAIVAPEEEHSSRWDDALRLVGRVLGALGEVLIPSAQAQNIVIDSGIPTLTFTDIDDDPPRAAALVTNVPDAADNFRLSFELQGRDFNNKVIDIDTDISGDRSIVIDLNGDIGLANNGIFIDRSASVSTTRLGIGTTIPEANLHISSLNPEIRLHDETFVVPGGTTNLDIGLDSGTLVFRGQSSQRFVSLRNTAPSDSLVIGTDGSVGLGTSLPEASLEVTRSDGSTQVLVEDTSATTANRQLIQLSNNGRPQVRLSNTDSDVNWVTGMGTDDAYILRRGGNEYRFTKGGRVRWFLDGVTDPIFDFNNNGNLTLDGTLNENSDVNAKRDIVPVDGAAVLARVAALPVSTWTYKDDGSGARHVGPMAQDFHAAFGLGEDDRHVSPRDVAGVALAAVKQLQAVVRDAEHRLREKDAQIAALAARLAAVEARLGE